MMIFYFPSQTHIPSSGCPSDSAKQLSALLKYSSSHPMPTSDCNAGHGTLVVSDMVLHPWKVWASGSGFFVSTLLVSVSIRNIHLPFLAEPMIPKCYPHPSNRQDNYPGNIQGCLSQNIGKRSLNKRALVWWRESGWRLWRPRFTNTYSHAMINRNLEVKLPCSNTETTLRGFNSPKLTFLRWLWAMQKEK